MLNRRVFLGTIAGTALHRLAPVIALAPIFLPTTARAIEPITVVIAVAAAVAGMIAAHNRGGGALGDYLSALMGKVDVTIEQLASLQDAVSKVLVKLSTLTSEFDVLLREDEVRNLHDVTYSAVISYTKLVRVRENYKTDKEFMEAPGVALDVRSTLDRLEAATALLRQKKSFGPTSAMIIPSAFLLEHSLLLLRGDRPRDIAARLEASVEWLDQVSDPLVSTSTATYRAQAVVRHQQYKAAALQNALGKQLANLEGVALFDCAGVNQYIGEHPGTTLCDEPDFLNLENSSPQNATVIPIKQVTCTTTIPEAWGPPTEARFQNIKLEQKPYNVPVLILGQETERPAGFLQLILSKQPMSELLPAKSQSLPPSCPFHSARVGAPQSRADWIENYLNKSSPKEPDYKQLQTLVDGMNLERARISLATSALTIVANGRTELTSLIRNLRG